MARSKQGSVVERKRKNGKKQLYARIRWTERIGGKTVQREKFARVRTRTEGAIGCKGAISASIEALDTMKNTSLEPPSPQFELNALAPLRVGGLARALLENKDNPAEVERIANELLALEPHLIEMLIAEGEKVPALV